MSTFFVSKSDFPLSSVSSCASSVACVSIRSATRSRSFSRCAGGMCDHLPSSKTRRAALAARSTSMASPSATCASSEPSAGFTVAKVLPEAASTHFPSMSILRLLALTKRSTEGSMCTAASMAVTSCPRTSPAPRCRQSARAVRGSLSARDRDAVRNDPIQAPPAGQAFQLVLAVVRELQARPGHQVLHRARGDDLARAGDRQDTRGGMHRNAAEVVATDLAFTRVYARPDPEAERAGAVDDRHRATERACGAVEAREEAVPGRLHLAPVEALQL